MIIDSSQDIVESISVYGMESCLTLYAPSQEGHYVLETAAVPNDGGFEPLLRQLGNVERVEHTGEYYVIYSRTDLRRELIRKSLQGGYTISHLRQRGSDLDEIYRRYFEKGEKEHVKSDQRKSGRFLSFRKNK